MTSRHLLFGAALFVGVLCANNALAAPGATCQQYGEIAFAAWTQGLDAHVGDHFAPEVKIHLPPGVLHEMWTQLQAQAGKFVSLGQFEPRTLDGHALMVAPIDFTSKRLAALFSCNAKNQITGLQVLDPNAVPGLKALVPTTH
ncbi:MAG TPA: hypothetical protein VF264_04090 [Rhodanobacteraceae bacterium]